MDDNLSYSVLQIKSFSFIFNYINIVLMWNSSDMHMVFDNHPMHPPTILFITMSVSRKMCFYSNSMFLFRKGTVWVKKLINGLTIGKGYFNILLLLLCMKPLCNRGDSDISTSIYIVVMGMCSSVHRSISKDCMQMTNCESDRNNLLLVIASLIVVFNVKI